MTHHRLSPDLFSRVRNAIARHGYCILGTEEMERLLFHIAGNRATKARLVQQFAEACGAEVETTAHLTSARFVKTRKSRASGD